MKTKSWFRLLEDGEEARRGAAYEADDAFDKAFYDEQPGSIPEYQLDRWDGKKWVRVFSGRITC